MLRIQVILGNNDVMAISEGLKKIGVGGLTVGKIRGRGKNPPPEIHSSKGTGVFVPQFSEKYIVELVIPETKEEEAIKIIRENSKLGKIFVSPILRAVDIASGQEGEETI